MKTIVYIDGQNFLYKVADILIEAQLVQNKQAVSSIDIRWLMSQIIDGKFDIRFYGIKKISRQKNMEPALHRKSLIFSDNLRKLRNCLTKQEIQYVDVGMLKIRDTDICKKCGNQELHFQEKGVDVGLAIDLVKDTLLRQVDRIVLVSSDTDLMPAILTAKDAEKEIVYVGFEDRLTKALASQANSVQILRKKEVIEAWNRMIK